MGAGRLPGSDASPQRRGELTCQIWGTVTALVALPEEEFQNCSEGRTASHGKDLQGDRRDTPQGGRQLFLGRVPDVMVTLASDDPAPAYGN